MTTQPFELIELDDMIELVGQDVHGRPFELRWPRQLAVSTAVHILTWDAAGQPWDEEAEPF